MVSMPTTLTAPAYVVDAVVAHRRTRPWDYAFTHRTTSWLVDADSPNAAFPRWLGPLLQIRGRDHLGAGDGAVADKVRRTLGEHGQEWSAAQVLMLTNARTSGHVFDPLTTYFCFAADGTFEGILAEVHNTHGEQHCYPLPGVATTSTDGNRRTAVDTTVDKEFYVSPFFTVAGRYDIKARLTDDQVVVSIALTQDGERVFSASVRGELTAATRPAVLRAFLRRPFASQQVSVLIRLHGIRLWLRRLPVVPRRPDRSRTLRRAA